MNIENTSPRIEKDNTLELSAYRSFAPVPQPTLLDIAKHVFTRFASVRPFLAALTNRMISWITFGKTSRVFHAKSLHSLCDLYEIWTTDYFKHVLKGRPRNIGTVSTFGNEKSGQVSEELLRHCRNMATISNFVQIDRLLKTAVENFGLTDNYCKNLSILASTHGHLPPNEVKFLLKNLEMHPRAFKFLLEYQPLSSKALSSSVIDDIKEKCCLESSINFAELNIQHKTREELAPQIEKDQKEIARLQKYINKSFKSTPRLHVKEIEIVKDLKSHFAELRKKHEDIFCNWLNKIEEQIKQIVPTQENLYASPADYAVYNSHTALEHAVQLIDDMDLDIDKNPSKMITDGICAGFRLDLVNQHLLQGKNFTDLSTHYNRGTKSAANANQAIYELFHSRNPKPEEFLFLLLKELEKVFIERAALTFQVEKAHSDTLSLQGGQAMFMQIAHGFIAAQRKGISSIKNAYPIESQQKSNQTELCYFIEKLIQEEMNKPYLKMQAHPWLSQEGRIVKFDIFKSEVMSVMEKYYNSNAHLETPEQARERKKQFIQALDWVIAHLEITHSMTSPSTDSSPNMLKSVWLTIRILAAKIFRFKLGDRFCVFDYITDPTKKRILEGLYINAWYNKPYELVAAIRGVKIGSAGFGLSQSYTFESDDAFFHQFKAHYAQLQTNVDYSVDIKIGSDGHALTFSKESDEKSYIIDPNGLVVECTNVDHTIETFRKILSLGLYQVKEQDAKGHPNHHIQFKKMEKL